MNSIYLKSYNSICKISSSSSSVLEKICSSENEYSLSMMVPSSSVIDGHHQKVDVELDVIEDNSALYKMIEQYPFFKIIGSEINHKDIVACSEYLFERSRQEKGIYNLHSSCIGNENSCAIIYGSSKCGKTVLSLEASQNYGLNFLSNERALINLKKRRLVGGCTYVKLENYHNDIFLNFKDVFGISLENNFSGNYDIRLLVKPNIDSGLKELCVDRIDIKDAEWELYPELSSRIKGTNKRMNNFTFPLDSLDTKELARKRMASLGDFLKRVPVYFVRGKKEDIVKFISSQL